MHVQFYITRCMAAGIKLPYLPGLCSPGPNPICVPLPSSEKGASSTNNPPPPPPHLTAKRQPQTTSSPPPLTSNPHHLKDFHWSDEEVAQYMTITHPSPVKCCWQKRRFVLLSGVRNVGHVVKYFLQHNSNFFNAIVVLDDRSDDGTRSSLARYGASNKLEVLVVKNKDKMPPHIADRRDELRDRNLLVRLGRQIGGTHFAMMDYDELIRYVVITAMHALRLLVAEISPRTAFWWEEPRVSFETN